MNNKISRESIKELEASLKYNFANIELLSEALTHPSMNQKDNCKKDYERLEFLGDSILGFLITEKLYNKHQKLPEGKLAKIKAYLVSNKVVVQIAKNLRLFDYLIVNQGEEKSGGLFNSNNLENAMEALIAAIYLDSDISVIRKIVENLWKDYIENINLDEVDPKTTLQEYLQSKGLNIPKYEIIKQYGPVHAPIFTIKVSSNNDFEIAEGKSIKQAEKKAAKKLLDLLKK